MDVFLKGPILTGVYHSINFSLSRWVPHELPKENLPCSLATCHVCGLWGVQPNPINYSDLKLGVSMGQYLSTKEGNQTNCISSPFSSWDFQVACCLVLVCLQPKWAWVEVDQVSGGNFMIGQIMQIGYSLDFPCSKWVGVGVRKRWSCTLGRPLISLNTGRECANYHLIFVDIRLEGGVWRCSIF